MLHTKASILPFQTIVGQSPVDKLFTSLGILGKLLLCHTLDALRDAGIALVQNLETTL